MNAPLTLQAHCLPLFLSFHTGFLGTEYNILDVVKCNINWRAIYKIPVVEVDNKTEGYKSLDFFDLMLTTKKFWNKAEFSFVALNISNNREGAPAYGEHAGNRNGTFHPKEQDSISEPVSTWQWSNLDFTNFTKFS